MEISYSLHKDDLIALAQYQIEHSPAVERRSRFGRMALSTGFLLMAIGNYLILGSITILVAFAALAESSFILYPSSLRWLARRSVPRIVQEKMRPSSFARRILRVTPDGLEQLSDSGASKVKWKLVDGIDVTPSYTYIFIEGASLVVIPKASIGPETHDKFINVFRQYRNASKAEVGQVNA